MVAVPFAGYSEELIKTMPTRGPSPDEYISEQRQHLATLLTKAALNLSAEVTKAMPVGTAGELQRSWTPYPATPDTLKAGLSTSSAYFLPVELGRKPGKGINRQGQEAVTLWARRKLGMDPKRAVGFAYQLSEKYKREGRPAQGIIGLASRGDRAGDRLPTDPVPGSILAKAFQTLDNELNK